MVSEPEIPQAKNKGMKRLRAVRDDDSHRQGIDERLALVLETNNGSVRPKKHVYTAITSTLMWGPHFGHLYDLTGSEAKKNSDTLE